MSTHEDVSEQQALLERYRKTLAILLDQRAQQTTAHVPPATVHGIDEARAHIRRIKDTLQGWGLQVADHPNDDEQTRTGSATTVSQQVQTLRFDLALEMCVLADRFAKEARKMRSGIAFGNELKDVKDGDNIMLVRQRKAAEILTNLQQINQKAKFVLPCGSAVDEKISGLVEVFNKYSVHLHLHFDLGARASQYLSIGLLVPNIFEAQAKDSIDKVFLSGGDEFIKSVDGIVTELNSLLVLYTQSLA